MQRHDSKVHKLTELALLTSAALIMFVIELQIPYPFPISGIKLGLANIITVYAVYQYKPSEVLMIILVRIFLGSVFSANYLALAFSISGALLCWAGMIGAKHIIDEEHIWLASILGAVLHNTGQILAAVVVMKTFTVFVYLPFLIVAGCIAGAFTGFTAQIIISRLNHKHKNQ